MCVPCKLYIHCMRIVCELHVRHMCLVGKWWTPGRLKLRRSIVFVIVTADQKLPSFLLMRSRSVLFDRGQHLMIVALFFANMSTHVESTWSIHFVDCNNTASNIFQNSGSHMWYRRWTWEFHALCSGQKSWVNKGFGWTTFWLRDSGASSTTDRGPTPVRAHNSLICVGTWVVCVGIIGTWGVCVGSWGVSGFMFCVGTGAGSCVGVVSGIASNSHVTSSFVSTNSACLIIVFLLLHTRACGPSCWCLANAIPQSPHKYMCAVAMLACLFWSSTFLIYAPRG